MFALVHAEVDGESCSRIGPARIFQPEFPSGPEERRPSQAEPKSLVLGLRLSRLAWLVQIVANGVSVNEDLSLVFGGNAWAVVPELERDDCPKRRVWPILRLLRRPERNREFPH